MHYWNQQNNLKRRKKLNRHIKSKTKNSVVVWLLSLINWVAIIYFKFRMLNWCNCNLWDFPEKFPPPLPQFFNPKSARKGNFLKPARGPEKKQLRTRLNPESGRVRSGIPVTRTSLMCNRLPWSKISTSDHRRATPPRVVGESIYQVGQEQGRPTHSSSVGQTR